MMTELVGGLWGLIERYVHESFGRKFSVITTQSLSALEMTGFIAQLWFVIWKWLHAVFPPP
jgi:hypothetical protein